MQHKPSARLFLVTTACLAIGSASFLASHHTGVAAMLAVATAIWATLAYRAWRVQRSAA